MKTPGSATITISSHPMAPIGRQKERESNAYKLNKQMDEKHIDQRSLLQEDSNPAVDILAMLVYQQHTIFVIVLFESN